MTDTFVQRRWVAVATQQAAIAEIEPSLLLGGCRKHKVARARWQAFKTVLDAHPRISIKRLADVSGFDHTTLMHGLMRVSGASVAQVRRSKATGRRPARVRLLEAAE